MPALSNNLLANNPLDLLRFSFGDFILYKAGLPTFPRTFTRDVIISAILMNDAQMLEHKLRFAASKQGSKIDSRTGEQPGIIFHEYDTVLNDGVELLQRPGFTTFYNASDTTALFLIGHEKYQELTKDKTLTVVQYENILKAVSYILNHLNKDNVFFEDPKLSNATTYALKVTYWKDSELLNRKNGEPSYPVVYPLVHIQNMAGLRAGADILNSSYLAQSAEKMRKAILLLYNKKLKNFPIAIDKMGDISAISSDGLNALFYLKPGDVPKEIIKEIIQSSEVLETPLGYRTLDPKVAEKVSYFYHAKTVWTQEQAQIHMGASKHLIWAMGQNDLKLANLLNHVKEVSFRVTDYLYSHPKSFPEIFVIDNGKILPGGCDPQLWAIAASTYFKSLKSGMD